MSTKTIWHDLVVARNERKAARAQLRELQAALSVYTSPVEIEDMLATVEGQDSADADLVRTILTHNLAADRTHRAHLRAPIAA